MGYSFRITARVILYAPSPRQDNTYHGLCYTSRGALAGTRNSSMGPACSVVPPVYKTVQENILSRIILGVITPNQIPLTTIVTYLQFFLQKQNFKPLGHYTCMQCGTSRLQTVQKNILSHIILATYRKFTVATVIFTQNVSCNIFTHPRYQQVANVTHCVIIHQTTKATEYIG